MGTHKITFTFLVGKWSQKIPVVLPVGVKYKVKTWGSLKTKRKVTPPKRRIDLTTKLYFQEDLVMDVDLI